MEKADKLFSILLKLAAIIGIALVVKIYHDQSKNGRYVAVVSPESNIPYIINTQTGAVTHGIHVFEAKD